MNNPSFNSIIRNYIRYRKIRRRIAKVYYSRLVKASLLISTVPIIVIIIMVIYERLTLNEGLFATVAVIFGSTFFAKPYLADLSSLTHYVEQLALDKRSEAPMLSYLGNVEELSSAVRNLHRSWGIKKMKLEAAIAESKILFDTLPDILIMIDDKMRIERANNGALVKLGQDIIGKPIGDILHDIGIDSMIDEVLHDGHGKSIEFPITRHQVESFYSMRIERFPISSPGGIAAVIVLHDITESKRTKQMVKDFVANASHEIRTPLTSLFGFIETLQHMEKDKEDDPKARQHFLDIMSEQSEHMTKLVEDLLSLSKVEISENSLPTEAIDLSEILTKSRRSSEWLSKKKNIRIIQRTDRSIPPIKGDYKELEQVFINLISNAIKYSPSDTTIRVRANCDDHHVYTSVIDEGEGIPKEHLERITERFYRVDKVRSKKVGGTGLGLAIVKHIINRHRGELLIESEPGKGSTFTVKLPI